MCFASREAVSLFVAASLPEDDMILWLGRFLLYIFIYCLLIGLKKVKKPSVLMPFFYSFANDDGSTGTGWMDRTIKRGTASMDREIRVSCNECCRNFPSNNLLEIHHSKHHYIRQCPNCKKTFQHTKKYLKHLRSHLKYCPYHCKICLKSFQNKRSLYYHKIRHNKLEKKICRKCGLKFNDYLSLTSHLTTHGKPPYKCSKCACIFSRPIDRQTHMQNHILRCELCKIPMKSRDDLFYHINEKHRTNKMDHVPVLTPLLEYPDNVYIGKCDSSDSMAESSSSDGESDISSNREANADINSVYNAKHRGRFICFICLQLCPNSELLKYHMKAHNWFPCPSCAQFFDCLHDLEMHKKENHYQQCTLCKATYQSERDLHMPECRVYCNIKLKLTQVFQSVLESKSSDRYEMWRKLKVVEKDLEGDCEINFVFIKSTNCLENVCKDRIAESFIHYHFPHDLVFDVNFSNSVRNPVKDLFNLSDTLLQAKDMENFQSYESLLRFSTEISVSEIMTFLEEAKNLQFPLEPHVVEQIICFNGIIEDAFKSPVSEEMPEDLKDYLTHVNYYLSHISRKHINT
ncbi:hypothetical protein TNCV_4733262 [Trichonephila clavipes]|nr:hypothetical protein TNCV_4733262 [Trichonephila clavipes]